VSEGASINNKTLNQKLEKNEEKVRGYIPRGCDFKCYKCPHQGDCAIPRRLIEARRRYALRIENKKTFLKYMLNNLALTLSLYDRILRPIFNVFSRLNRNFRYRRNLLPENVYLNNRFKKYRRARA